MSSAGETLKAPVSGGELAGGNRQAVVGRWSTSSAGHRIGLGFVVGVLIFPVLIALAVRVAPLVEGGDRLQRQCVTEDGYLMLTIARNIALGRGFSVSGGEIASNGTQPLATLLYAACFAAVDGDALRGLYPVVGLQVLISIAAALALYWATSRCFYRGPGAVLAGLLAATLWFVSPSSVMHSQNGLETGLVALLVVVSLAMYDKLSPRLLAGWAPGSCLILGGLLGATFLGRNDACLLIAVLLLVHLWRGYRLNRPGPTLGQSFLVGLTSVAVASPWLWFNLSRFGHLMPVSGRAESLHVDLGLNFLPSFVALVENASLVLRVPGSLEQNPWIVFGCMAVVILGVGFAWSYRGGLGSMFSAGTGVLAGFVAALFVFYAFFFGMPSFLGRYYFPMVTLAAILAGGAVSAYLPRAAARATLIAAVAAVAVIACVGLNARIYHHGREHMHFQVVDWVRENVPASTWVGAIQTGTLGYYHERTMNLDGKVNPEAFEYRREGRIHDYVIAKNVQYIADWAGIAQWAQWPGFAPHYELIVHDEDRGPNGLAVLKRRAGAPAESAALPEPGES